MMPEHEITAAMVRIHGASDPWAELSLWLQERSALNESLGGAEVTFISLVIMSASQLSLPTRN